MELSIEASAAWSAHGPEPGAVGEGLTANKPLAPHHDPPRTPPPGVLRAAGFDVRAELGVKGTRSMDRATALTLATTGRLLKTADPGLDGARTALILGTTTGSLGSIMDFTASTLTGGKPYLVNPGKFPVTVMNYAAGQCAIRHGITGPNVTVAGGRNAFAMQLLYAARLLRAGRADDVLCGAAEECSSQRAWLEWRSRPPGTTDSPIAEGCVMFHLTAHRTPGRPVLQAVATVLCDDEAPEAGIADCMTAAMSDAGVSPAEVWAVAGNGALDGHLLGEDRALRKVFGSPGPRRVLAHTVVGDTSAASVGFQLLALLELSERDPATRSRTGLVTSIDRYGLATALVVRCPR